jgi:hypothetical protein
LAEKRRQRSRYRRSARKAVIGQSEIAFQLGKGGHWPTPRRITAAKERIRAMEYRYIEEADQNRQALLEIYCAVVLATP